ncbi:hypothetical protein G5C51_02760 [Streptomyces sp. A7024]|uniref:Uncharacterized protein n=1 Tax=Streptomyces coryli TaxID=1128680 RepID=A0A6G4TSJ2_9ACTN|nr:hypothetical protein [Streptomyces coryli]NGN62824.1 hypothetical protein [Streptomyces coryli]
MSRRTTPSVATSAEPAMRPAGQGRPGLDIVRNCRVSFDGSALVATGRDGARRSFPVGEGGIVKAVFVDKPGESVGGGMAAPAPGGWGELLFLDAAGAVVVRLRLDDWVPEGDRLGIRPVRGERLLALSGAGALCKRAGIAVSVSRVPAEAGGTSLRLPMALPAWYSVVRVAATVVWAVAWFVGVLLRPDAPWLLALAAVAALAGPVAYFAVRSAHAARERGAAEAGGTRISPSPAAGAGATVRFCETAAVRVEPQEIVLVDSVGHERRLARSGAHGVTRLVRHMDRKTGEPVGVELCGPDGQVRGALPWRWWFAGPEGERRWEELRAVGGLQAEDRATAKGVSWPVDPVAEADASLMGQMPAARARQASRFPESVMGVADRPMAALMAVLSLGAGISAVEEPGYRVAVIAVSELALCGSELPRLAYSLRSRMRLDRPAPGQEPTA